MFVVVAFELTNINDLVFLGCAATIQSLIQLIVQVLYILRTLFISLESTFLIFLNLLFNHTYSTYYSVPLGYRFDGNSLASLQTDGG